MKARADTPERIDRLLSRLGYASRREARRWLRDGRVCIHGRPARSPAEKAAPSAVCVDGEPLDHPFGLTLIYHKPTGSVCSHRESGRLIHDDLPERWQRRNPPLSSVGRLDKETGGLLILTDDGALNHALTHPRRHVPKVYRVTTARPITDETVRLFASGALMLAGERTPCLPARLRILGETEAELTLTEGRYHQARRMFAAAGNHVTALQRIAIGGLRLEDTGLAPGEWQVIEPASLLAIIHAG